MKNALGKVVRKTLTKKEALKLQPGMLVRVAWLDGDDSVHLVLNKPDRKDKYPSISTWTSDIDGTRDLRSVGYDQIVEVVGEVDFEVDDMNRKMHVHTKQGTTIISLN